MKQAVCFEGVDPHCEIEGGCANSWPFAFCLQYCEVLCLVPRVSGGGRGRLSFQNFPLVQSFPIYIATVWQSCVTAAQTFNFDNVYFTVPCIEPEISRHLLEQGTGLGT